MSVESNRNVSKMQTTYVEQQEYAEIASARKRKLVLRRLSVFFVFASLLTYLMISSYISQTTKLESTLEQKQKLNQQLADIKKQQTILKEDIVKLNDDDYIAKLARKEYFFSKKGEIIFNIPDDSKEN